LVTERSALGLTPVLIVDVLFERLESPEVVEAVAVLVIVPVAVGVTTIVTVALVPLFMALSEQVTMGLELEHVPLVVATETSVTLAGRVSVITTELARAVP
jgi:hypothetical protein